MGCWGLVGRGISVGFVMGFVRGVEVWGSLGMSGEVRGRFGKVWGVWGGPGMLGEARGGLGRSGDVR